ncbi:bifunctional hydroxymethylpyrimidine kinase/phosphomethylpyrimidine kinase [Streptococcus himalayensis]|uniref:pyridoxal kinase n=1 Tax=Streptococcus himalayensis TaxID=1888195 RepID=A0A917EFX1_9STRE|nr:bifunctional hydroxymethylpyrimidine kinase/phosphomethylpyrimidine kinase [Streptococcus himalayensis]GGE34859.1 hydroxymethylpyrimidine/phosphomethylpyrimidine kinase [Streptococcus himalayensis]
MKNELVLAISGNDIYSGGGLYADLITYAAHGQHGFVAVTCLTAMTEQGFEVFATDTEVFRHQLNSLVHVPFSAVKIGLLPNVEIAGLTLDFIQQHATIPVILDPVLVCKETHDVEVTALREELFKLFPYATILTPNLAEAQLLTQKEIKTLKDMEIAAKELHRLGAKAVVIKGGTRFSESEAIDLFYDGQNLELLRQPLLEGNNTGAGCTFASAIASLIVNGESVSKAVAGAKEFVYRSIQKSDKYGVIQYEK